MTERIVELARKMRQYGLWGGHDTVTIDARLVLARPPGKAQKEWGAEVLYFDGVAVAHWIGPEDDISYDESSNKLPLEELCDRMETMFLTWLENDKPYYTVDGEDENFIWRQLTPMMLVGLTEVEKTQWEIDIFLVNVGKKKIEVTIKSTGKHFCTLNNLDNGKFKVEWTPACTPRVLAGILIALKRELRTWWEGSDLIAKEPVMAVCDPEGVWTISYKWVAWGVTKGNMGATPTGPITHAIMHLEKLHSAGFEKVISEKVGSDPRKFRLYQITKTLVKPGDEEKGEA